FEGVAVAHARGLAPAGRRARQEIEDRVGIVERRGRVVGIGALEFQDAAISGVEELLHRGAAKFVTPLQIVPAGCVTVIIEELQVAVRAATVNAGGSAEVGEARHSELRNSEIARVGYPVI